MNNPATDLANARYLARVLAGLNLDLGQVPAARESVVTLEILREAKAKLLAIDTVPLTIDEEGR